MSVPRSNAGDTTVHTTDPYTIEEQQVSKVIASLILGLKNKSLEKALLYGVAAVGATNGFSFIHMNTTLREVLVASAAGVLAFIHQSTPVVK